MDSLIHGIQDIKISPFAGGLTNSSYAKPLIDDSRDISEIFQNKNNIDTLLKFLSEYRLGTTQPIKGILLRGSVGCGKMSLIRACLKKLNYLNLTYDTDYETEDIFETLLISIEAKGITKLFYNCLDESTTRPMSKKKAIIIRDIDNALRPTQKSDFFKFLQNSKFSLPLIMTSNDKSVGTRRDVPKIILQLDFQSPTIRELVDYFENPKISRNALERVIIDSNFDLRYIDNFINGLEYSKKKLNITKVSTYSKDLELDTFKCINHCFDPNNDLQSKLTYTTLYTNSTIFHNYPSCTKTIETCSEIADTCRSAEEIVNFSFENQDWGSLDNMYGYIGTIAPLKMIRDSHGNIDNLVYPSSNLLGSREDNSSFKQLEKDSMILKILIGRYFKGTTLIGNADSFKTELKKIRDPIKAYKLGHMMTLGHKQSQAILKIIRSYNI